MLRNWMKKWFRTSSSKRTIRSRKAALSVETLEGRDLMAAGLSASLTKGILTIQTTPESDQIVLRQSNNRISVVGMPGSFAAAKVKKIMVEGFEGDDAIKVKGGAGAQKLTAPVLRHWTSGMLQRRTPLGAWTTLVGPTHHSNTDSSPAPDPGPDGQPPVWPNAAPVLGKIGDQWIKAGASLSIDLSASDIDGDAITYSATMTGQDWETITAESAATPLQLSLVGNRLTITTAKGWSGGNATIEVKASDGRGSGVRTFAVHVAENQAPVLEAIPEQIMQAGATLTLPLSATDANGDAVRYFARIVPTNADNNESSPTISAAVIVEGSQLVISANGYVGEFTVEVTADDGEATATATFLVHSRAEWRPEENVLPPIFGIPGSAAGNGPDKPLAAVDFVKKDSRLDPRYQAGFDEMQVGDFDGDGRDDLFFRKVLSGENALYISRGVDEFIPFVNPVRTGWINDVYTHMVVGDFTGDGRSDLLFIGRDGGNRLVSPGADGVFRLTSAYIAHQLLEGFDTYLAGDFDADGWADMFMLKKGSSGEARMIYTIPNSSYTYIGQNQPIGNGWINDYDQVVVGDFNGDRYDDLFFRQIVSGSHRFAFGQGRHFIIGSETTDLIGRGAINLFDDVVVGNFNGDAYDDLLFRNIGDGVNRLALSTGGLIPKFPVATNSIETQWIDNVFRNAIAGNFDGDRDSDLLGWIPATGFTRICYSSESAKQFQEIHSTWQYRLNADGRLYRSNSSAGELIAENVRSFAIDNGALRVDTLEGAVEATHLLGDVNGFVNNAWEQDRSQAASLPDGVRPIIGTTLDQYLQHSALLDPVGVVYVDHDFNGTGILLAWGKRRFVLTAAHVVEDRNTHETLDQSRITFVPKKNNPRENYFVPTDPSAIYRVKHVYGRDQFKVTDSDTFGRDLALLELEREVEGVQGALLPSGSEYAQQTVFIAGYGGNNAGARFGGLNFGFARLDGADRTWTGGDRDRHPGEHVTLVFQAGMAGTEHGDSGGPYFKVRRERAGDGNWYWVPELLAVNSFGVDMNDNHQNDYGDQDWGVQLTGSVVSKIQNLIGLPNPYAKFILDVGNDGEGPGAGTGEWVVSLSVQSGNRLETWTPPNGNLDVGENSTNTIDHQYFFTWGQPTLTVTFGGFERDLGPDSWFDSDEKIDTLVETIGVPTNLRRFGEKIRIGARSNNDTSYVLSVVFGMDWR